ncbi:hypothetical protein LguiB_003434 [Lonicera macranthoides]
MSGEWLPKIVPCVPATKEPLVSLRTPAKPHKPVLMLASILHLTHPIAGFSQRGTEITEITCWLLLP